MSEPKPKKHPPTEIYAESVVWNCLNLKTGLETRISGALAQVLKKYPADYELQLIALQEGGVA